MNDREHAASNSTRGTALGDAVRGRHSWIEVPADERGEAIVAALALGGVEYLFFNSGSEIMFLQEGIAKARALGRPAPKLVMLTHEYPTLNAALGYAAATGKPAATAVHVDVGTQHYGCAIHTARWASQPIVVMAGAPPVSYPGSMRGSRDGSHFWLQQTPDQAGIVRQYMKWDHRLEYQDNPGLIVSRALQIAQSEPRGPVYLTLPREISFLKTEGARFPTAEQLGITVPSGADEVTIADLAQRLLLAKNPMVITARSGRNPATIAPLVRLCELLGMPVGDAAARTYHCFPMNHPLYQGSALDLREADFVLVLEADVPWIPGGNAPLDNAYIAVLDSDPIKSHIATYEFTADARLRTDTLRTLEALCAKISEVMRDSDRAGFATRASDWAERSRQRALKDEEAALSLAKNTPISPLWLSYQLGKLFDDNSLVIDETLMLSPLPRYLKLSTPGSYFRNPGSAGGWAAGAAFGAKLGQPSKDVIAVSGDGFYMYSVATAAISAAVRYNAPFLSVIYQNRSYSTGTAATAQAYPDGYAIRGGLDGGYFDPPMDFAKEAEAAGGYGENVRDPEDLSAALRRGLDKVRSGMPAVISVWLPRIMQQD
jgi:acetolactate synthase-1/2/3 large subunit